MRDVHLKAIDLNLLTALGALLSHRSVSRAARDLSTGLGVRLLGEVTRCDELRSLPAFAPERLTTTARIFLDIIAVPMLLRALYETNLDTLEAEIDLRATFGAQAPDRPLQAYQGYDGPGSDLS